MNFHKLGMFPHNNMPCLTYCVKTTRVGGANSNSTLSLSFAVSEPGGAYTSSKLRERFLDYSKGSIPEVSITNEDSRTEQKYTDGKSPIMWIITEDNT